MAPDRAEVDTASGLAVRGASASRPAMDASSLTSPHLPGDGNGDCPEVDVVLVAFNGGAALRQAVASILASRGVRPHVILVDNASTDGSTDDLEEGSVSILRLRDNIGYGAGFNRGLVSATAPWVVCANQDISLPPDTLQQLIETSLGWPAGDAPIVTTPRIVRSDGSTCETYHVIPSFRRECYELVFGGRVSRNVIDFDDRFLQPVACEWVSAVFVLGRRTVFEQLGGFDPEYFMYVEDLDFFRRLHDRGGYCVWDPRATVIHHGGIDAAGKGAISGVMYARTLWNIRRYFEKNEPHRSGVWAVAVHAAGTGGAVARALLWSGRSVRARSRRPGGETSNDRNAAAIARMFGSAAWWSGIALATGRLPSTVLKGPMLPSAGHRPRAVFFAKVRDLRLLDLIEFYSEDLKALEDLGFEVYRTNSPVVAARADGELLYAWWWHSSLAVTIAWRLRGRPVVVTGTSDLFEQKSSRWLRSKIRSLLTCVAVRVASVNIAVSDVEVRKLERIRAPRLERLHHAVDTTFFHPGTRDEAPTAIIVAQLYGGNIKRKGVDTSIRAVTQIRQSVPDFRLRLVGPVTDDGRDTLDRLRREVDFAGIDVVGEATRDEKQHLLSRSWFLLQPSLYEGFGLAVLEAMACGVIPIVSGAGALPEVVGPAGIVLEAASPQSVAEAVITLMQDRARRDDLSRAARARSIEFDRGRHTQLLSEILGRCGVRVPSEIG